MKHGEGDLICVLSLTLGKGQGGNEGVGYKVGGPWPWPSQRKSCLDKMVGCGEQVRGGGGPGTELC